MPLFNKRGRRTALRSNERRTLRAETLERRMLLTAVTGSVPAPNSHTAPVSTDIAATFDQSIDPTTATPETFVVHSQQRGQLVGSLATAGAIVTFDATANFFPGELVRVSATPDIQSTSGDAAEPRVWEFRTEVSGGSGELLGGDATRLGSHHSYDVGMGDLDGDGDLDAIVTNWENQGNRVWVNDGGQFSDSGQILGFDESRRLAMGDLDGDGDLDVFIANVGPNRVWLNDGGVFRDSGQLLGNLVNVGVGLGDFDGDGDLDAVMATTIRVEPAGSTGENRIWLNSGDGTFTDSGQLLGPHDSVNISIGDLDDDGDLDIFVSNNTSNNIWINDGGQFTNSGQDFGSHYSGYTALGDLDGDGDLDAFVANSGENQVWLNNSGQFTDSGQTLGDHGSADVALGDLDGDGDLDAMVTNAGYQGNRIWLNNGSGQFSSSGQSLGTRNSFGVELGDLDNDGDLDAFVANDANIVGNAVWLNQNPPGQVTLSVDNSTIGESAGVATVTATLSATTAQTVTVNLDIAGTATVAADYTLSGTQIVIPGGATSGSVTVTAVQDTLDEPNETVIVDIESVTNGQEVGAQQVVVTIEDDDEPPMLDVTLAVDTGEIAEAGGVATFTVTLSESTTVPVTVDLAMSGTATASDYTVAGTQIVVAAGATTGSVTVTAVDDSEDEPDETVTVDISAVTNGNEDGIQAQTVTIVDDDTPASFSVTTLDPNESGFRVEFANPLDASELNLYDTENAGLGPADVVVTGAASGTVAGSIVIDTSAVTFIKSGGLLVADTYTVTLRSAADGFKNTAAMLLDGNADGTGGDDYVGAFTIAEPPADARTISIPDFVRGPGQSVNLPAEATTGIPITISEGDGVRAVDVRIGYDPALLEITGATSPAGGSVIVNTTTTPGVAILVFFSSASLPAGSGTFINLQATIPAENASAVYGTQQVLDIHSVTIGDGNDNEFPVSVDDALHLASYFADVSGNGRINASDAAQVARFAALIDNGFVGSSNADPVIVGDISGNGRINAADASRVARFAALIDVPEIPAIPGGIRITGNPIPGPSDARTPNTLETRLVDGGPQLTSSDDSVIESDATSFHVTQNFSSEDLDPVIVNSVDQLMKQLAESTAGELDEENSMSALEVALSELLSAVD